VFHDANTGEVAIDRRRSLTSDEFVSGYVIPRRPVVLVDAIRTWPAVETWTPEYFATRVGHKNVTVDGATYTVAQLADLIADSSPAAPAPYLRAQKVVDVFQELADDLQPPQFFSLPNWAESRLLPPSLRRARLHEILFGGRGAGFHVLHYDKDHLHAFVSQLYGGKEFFLYAPDQSQYLYLKASAPNQSSVDIFAPDLERHPRFSKAQQIRLELGPGETIFVPAGWWHTTRMPGPSISVTWNMVNHTNWADVSADTRRRVRAKTNAGVAAAFGLYAAAFAGLKATGDPRPALRNLR
jgi:cupin-like protein